jgi:hypothetical protein
MAETIDAQAVLTLAHAQGQAWVDFDTAGRIAAAATTAVQAVAASSAGGQPVLLEQSAFEFTAALEALADPPP